MRRVARGKEPDFPQPKRLLQFECRAQMRIVNRSNVPPKMPMGFMFVPCLNRPSLAKRRHCGGKAGDRRPRITARLALDDAIRLVRLPQERRNRQSAGARQRRRRGSRRLVPPAAAAGAAQADAFARLP